MFRQFVEKYDFEEIGFWRTSAQKEVDFVIQDKFAYEIKTNVNQFKKSKYRAFIEAYPEIKFFLIALGEEKDGQGWAVALEPWQL
ncbi:MAG: hypothetical protein HZA94_03180 [Candidatus Vogelbacteria bacterium]|nr:hypothetical protein [Candidatus Vogelbacteria bacterium]